MTRKATISSRMASYSTAAVALAALTPNAEAAITPINASNVTFGTGTAVEVDLDHDLTNDISLQANVVKHTWGTYTGIQVTPLHGEKFLASSQFTSTIDPLQTSRWRDVAQSLQIYSATKTFGIQFSSGTQKYVGWLRVSKQSSTGKLEAGAYQPASEGRIVAGETTDVIEPKTIAPATVNLTINSADFEITTDESATLHYIIQPATTSAPTLDQVKQGTPVSMVSGVKKTIALTSLQIATKYKIYYVVADSKPNYTALQTLSFSTNDYLEAFTIGDVRSSDARFSATSYQTGKLFYALLKSTDPAPTAAQIVLGKGFVAADSTDVTMHVAQDFKINRIESQTEFTLYVVTRNTSDQVSPVSQRPVRTGGQVSVLGSFDVSDIEATSATESILSFENGWIHYAVVKASTISPTPEELKAGSGAGFITHGTVAVTQFTQQSFAITGLESGILYYVYMSSETIGGYLWEAVVSGFQTKDIISPLKPTITIDSKLNVYATSNENGLLNYAVYKSSTPAPSTTDVYNGTGAQHTYNIQVSANQEDTSAMEGLTIGDTYKVYAFATDKSLNKSEVSDPIEFTYADVVAPSFGRWYTAIEAFENLASYSVNENGIAYFALRKKTLAKPTTAEIVAGSGFLLSSSRNVDTENYYDYDLGTLEYGADYELFVVLEDLVGNQSKPFVTSITPSFPLLSSPSLTSITSTGASLSVTSNRVGEVFVLVLPSTEETPTPNELLSNMPRSFISAANVPVEINLTDLSPLTSYKVIIQANNANWNRSALTVLDLLTLQKPAEPTIPEMVLRNTTVSQPAPYQVFNSSGRWIRNGIAQPGQTALSTGDLPRGNYYIKMDNGKTEKWIVRK